MKFSSKMARKLSVPLSARKMAALCSIPRSRVRSLLLAKNIERITTAQPVNLKLKDRTVLRDQQLVSTEDGTVAKARMAQKLTSILERSLS